MQPRALRRPKVGALESDFIWWGVKPCVLLIWEREC